MCPICAAPLSPDPTSRCPHVVAWMGNNGFLSPLDGLALPWLRGRAVGYRWPAHRIAEAFGDLAPLVDAYGAMADWRPGMSARVLWPLLAAFVDESVTAAAVGAGEDAETYWCTADPQRVGSEARATAALLAQGYAFLSGLADIRSHVPGFASGLTPWQPADDAGQPAAPKVA